MRFSLVLLFLAFVSAAGAQTELDRALRQRMPDASAAQITRAAADFSAHLRQVAPMAADSLAAGRMDQDDLGSRLDVFLGDHPELTGHVVPLAKESPRLRVSDALKAYPDVARSESERQTLADRFLADLPRQSGGANDALQSGSMSDDELQSRVEVFAGDVRADRARAAVDPAVAAAPAVVEAYEKANFGNAADRPESVCFKAEVNDGGPSRRFIEYHKRPNRVRVEIVEKGLAVAILAYDGTAAWHEMAGRPPGKSGAAEARSLTELARTFDPFFQYQDRGAVVRVLEHPENGPIRLSLRERDGAEFETLLDGKTYLEISRRFRQPDGNWNEVILSDFKKVGPMSVPCAQTERRRDGRTVTTRISDVSIDPGLIDEFFSPPADWRRGFMDFMGGLAVLEASGTRPAGPVSPVSGARP